MFKAALKRPAFKFAALAVTGVIFATALAQAPTHKDEPKDGEIRIDSDQINRQVRESLRELGKNNSDLKRTLRAAVEELRSELKKMKREGNRTIVIPQIDAKSFGSLRIDAPESMDPKLREELMRTQRELEKQLSDVRIEMSDVETEKQPSKRIDTNIEVKELNGLSKQNKSVDIKAFHLDLPKMNMHIPPIHIHIPAIHTVKEGKKVDIEPINIDIPNLQFDTNGIHIDIPAIHLNIPKVDVSDQKHERSRN